MDNEDFSNAFSMPIGGGEIYPRPPHHYRGVEDLLILYTADAEAIRPQLPPGVEPLDDPVPCLVKARWAPFSFHGPYHEAYIAVTVRFKGETYRYIPLIVTDSDAPLVAGREIWGYPKKLASIWHSWSGDDMSSGEQFAACVERPRGVPLVRCSMTCDRPAEKAELESLPALSLRLFPDPEGGAQPSIAELIRLDGAGQIHQGADGSPFLFAGRAALEMHAASASDPWHLFAPREIRGAFFFRADIRHEPGIIVHNYLSEPDLWK